MKSYFIILSILFVVTINSTFSQEPWIEQETGRLVVISKQEKDIKVEYVNSSILGIDKGKTYYFDPEIKKNRISRYKGSEFIKWGTDSLYWIKKEEKVGRRTNLKVIGNTTLVKAKEGSFVPKYNVYGKWYLTESAGSKKWPVIELTKVNNLVVKGPRISSTKVSHNTLYYFVDDHKLISQETREISEDEKIIKIVNDNLIELYDAFGRVSRYSKNKTQIDGNKSYQEVISGIEAKMKEGNEKAAWSNFSIKETVSPQKIQSEEGMEEILEKLSLVISTLDFDIVFEFKDYKYLGQRQEKSAGTRFGRTYRTFYDAHTFAHNDIDKVKIEKILQYLKSSGYNIEKVTLPESFDQVEVWVRTGDTYKAYSLSELFFKTLALSANGSGSTGSEGTATTSNCIDGEIKKRGEINICGDLTVVTKKVPCSNSTFESQVIFFVSKEYHTAWCGTYKVGYHKYIGGLGKLSEFLDEDLDRAIKLVCECE